MRFINPIPFVRDISRSKEFYRDILGIKVLKDFGDFVLFEPVSPSTLEARSKEQFGGWLQSRKNPTAEEICSCISNMTTLRRPSKTSPDTWN